MTLFPQPTAEQHRAYVGTIPVKTLLLNTTDKQDDLSTWTSGFNKCVLIIYV